MNFKTTYILFGALVVVLGIAAVSLLTGPKPGEEGKLLADVDPKDVTRVTLERKLPTESRLVFVRLDKDRWKLEQPFPAAVDGRQVESMVGEVVNARTVTKGADLSGGPAQFGLDQPALVLTLEAGPKTATVNFGRVA